MGAYIRPKLYQWRFPSFKHLNPTTNQLTVIYTIGKIVTQFEFFLAKYHMRFRNFYLLNESKSKKESGDLKTTLQKIPKTHRRFLKDYSFAFEGDNTLKGSDENIGVNDLDHKKIIIAAPWNYGREFTLLHEIAHIIWCGLLCSHAKKQWKAIVKKTKGKVNQSAEELFCHAYANTYSKNKIEVHNHPEWEKFIKEET